MESSILKKILAIILLVVILHSCEDCTVLEMTETSPLNCPQLMLNIGDACDDDNPDTVNDTVTNMCECVGEQVASCEGVLYASRITINEEGNTEAWFFDSAIRSAGILSGFAQIEQKANGFLSPNVSFNTNFAAFDPQNKIYTYAYQFNIGVPNPLYYAEINPLNTQFLEQELTYAAPVFLNGELYAISVQYDHPNASYSIVRIDQSTGMMTVLFSDNLVVNSPLANEVMSSISDNESLIYFISGTNLLIFDPIAMNVNYADIDEDYSSNNQIFHYGLEYKQDEDQLLAVKGRINSADKIAQLVSISTDGNYLVDVKFDMEDQFSEENDGEISFPFHSTTFSQCDNIYYISEIVELDVNPIESFLIEINLNQNTLVEQKHNDYIYGLEFDVE